MKKTILILSILLAIVSVAGCKKKTAEANVINPVVYYSTIEELNEASGIDFSIPNESTVISCSSIDDVLYECNFSLDEQLYTLRCSAKYEGYLNLGGLYFTPINQEDNNEYTIYEFENNRFAITWTDGEYNYCLDSSDTTKDKIIDVYNQVTLKTTSMANPWVSYDKKEDAEAAVGCTFEIPDDAKNIFYSVADDVGQAKYQLNKNIDSKDIVVDVLERVSRTKYGIVELGGIYSEPIEEKDLPGIAGTIVKIENGVIQLPVPANDGINRIRYFTSDDIDVDTLFKNIETIIQVQPTKSVE